MSTATFTCIPELPALLLVEPQATRSMRAAQLSRQQYRVTQTDSALDIFLLQHMLQFTVAVLSDAVGTQFLCSAAENIRRQWPLARILILGRVPDAMNDQLYDDTAGHSLDEDALLSTLDRLAEDPWTRKGAVPPVHLLGACAQLRAVRAAPPPESDPAKILNASPLGVYERDLPSDQHRSHHRGYYAFPPAS